MSSTAKFTRLNKINTMYGLFQISKLVEGNEYLFRICAENAIGASDWTTTNEAVKARLPFDPPGNFLLDLGILR